LCARAALFAGCKFFAAYPIAPAGGITHFLQREIWKHGGTFLAAEDEIAAAAAAVGASYAGAKSMTATSGPGFSLQTEVLGLASAVELPLVCVNVQRGGPATGMPTTQEQADLFAAVFSAHGDNVRPVLAPTSVADTFDVTVEAFNIAEHYQTPVIVLTDRDLALSKAVLEPINPSQLNIIDRLEPTKAELRKYARFQLTEAGISPLSHPGMRGGSYLAAGVEHDERGIPTTSGDVHARMTRKRLNKLNPLKARRDLFLFEGDPDAHIGLVSWGNVSGIVREAVRIARAKGIKVKLLVPRLLYPVAEVVYEDFFASLMRCVVVEQSHQGQLHRLLKMWTTTPREFMSVSKSGANRISPHEVVKLIQAMEKPATERFRTHYCDLLNVI
jgi:2-oxoglutarate ferredoxin oxidoreductase subunit alpha